MSIKEISSKLVVGLCKGRHSMPVSYYIFENEVNPLDLDKLNNIAFTRLNNLINKYMINPEEYELVIFVTGLTVALIELIKVAVELCFYGIVLMHYDRESNSYYDQIFF